MFMALETIRTSLIHSQQSLDQGPLEQDHVPSVTPNHVAVNISNISEQAPQY
jgi:hypothetical protein